MTVLVEGRRGEERKGGKQRKIFRTIKINLMQKRENVPEKGVVLMWHNSPPTSSTTRPFANRGNLSDVQENHGDLQ